MKKIVKANDIRRMIKMFNLTEDEKFQLTDLSDDINSQKNDSMYTTRLSFIMSPYCHIENKDRDVAVSSLLVYFGLKVQKEIGPVFKETCEELGTMLNANPQWFERWFRGMSFNNQRWSKRVYLADRCGLNTLELS